MTKIDKPVSRIVIDHHGNPLVVTLTAEGIVFRRPRKREQFVLPYATAETRAIVLANDGVGIAATGKRTRRVSRGLLSV